MKKKNHKGVGMKTVNPITKEKNITKRWNPLIGNSWRDNKPHPDALKDLAKRMRIWAQKDTSLRFDDFLDEENVPTSTYYTWRDECLELKDAHAFAIRRLASRREKLAFLKQADKEIFLRTQHMYDPRWDKEVNQYAKSLRLEEDVAPGKTKFIVVQVNAWQAENIENAPKYLSDNLDDETKAYLRETGMDKEIGDINDYRKPKTFNKS